MDIPPSSHCNATVLRMASRKLSHIYDVAFMAIGLRGTQFSLLAELGRRDGEPYAIKELAKVLVMDRSTLGQNLRPLERDGYVLVTRDEKDARKQRLYLTDSGKAILARGLEVWQDVQERIEEALGPTESRELRTALLALVRNQTI